MNEQKILERLCSHIMVIDKENPMDDQFFKHCYTMCMKNANNLTEESLWKLVDNQYKIRMVNEYKLIHELKSFKC